MVHKMDSTSIPPNNSNEELMANANEEPKISSITKSQWLTVGILCYVNLINYMDRYTVAGIMTDVKDEFHITDDKAGLLQTVFVISYMLFAPVFGYLGDRYNRKILMAFGVTLWGVTTFAGSFMDTYNSFLALRALVGIGEASYSTIAPTIISDLFVKNVRAKMLALFYFAIPVGSGLGYIVGSETAKLAGSWHYALRVTPVLAILAVLLILLLVQEPQRGESEGKSHLKPTSWGEDIVMLLKNRSFMFSTAGFMCVSFVTGALAWWGPDFIYRGVKLQPGKEDTKLNDISFIFGIIAMVSGLLGVPLGQFLACKLKNTNPRADPIICALGLLCGVPLLFGASFLPRYNTFWCFTLIFFGELFLNLNWSIVADMLVSFSFGWIAMLAGILGVPLGSFLSQKLRSKIRQIDPLVCGLGILLAVPLIGVAFFITRYDLLLCYLLIFFGQIAININWSITADILLYVVIPTRRSTAEAFQILVSHAFGDAGSPYFIGALADLAASKLRESVPASGNSTHHEAEISYYSLQYALFTTSFVEVLGGIFFLVTAIYIVKDRLRADREIRGENGENPNYFFADETNDYPS